MYKRIVVVMEPKKERVEVMDEALIPCREQLSLVPLDEGPLYLQGYRLPSDTNGVAITWILGKDSYQNTCLVPIEDKTRDINFGAKRRAWEKVGK